MPSVAPSLPRSLSPCLLVPLSPLLSLPWGNSIRRFGRRMARLLEGVTVLDLTRMLAGPYGALLLADLGAEVIKVEDPVGGDPVRAMGPPFVKGESAYFISINRNKKSLTLDLTTPRGREVFLGLVREADVVLDNFRPGILERLGVDYSAL